MSEPRDAAITRTDETAPVDVVEGPVGSAKLKEPSDVEGSVEPVEPGDLQVDVSDRTADGGNAASTPG